MKKIKIILLFIFPLFSSLISLLPITSCCDHELIRFCFHFTLKYTSGCENCGILQGSITKFTFRFRGQRYESDVLGNDPWQICLEGDENGGEEFSAELIRVCLDSLGKPTQIISCYSTPGTKTPQACDYKWKDVDVILTCNCIKISM